MPCFRWHHPLLSPHRCGRFQSNDDEENSKLRELGVLLEERTRLHLPGSVLSISLRSAEGNPFALLAF